MESIQVNWEIITWVAGSFAAIFTMLLSAIVYLIYNDKKQSTSRFDKHEQWIMKSQEEIQELSRTTGIALEHNKMAIEFIREIIQTKKKR